MGGFVVYIHVFVGGGFCGNVVVMFFSKTVGSKAVFLVMIAVMCGIFSQKVNCFLMWGDFWASNHGESTQRWGCVYKFFVCNCDVLYIIEMFVSL